MGLSKKREKQFTKFKKNILGNDAKIITPYGSKKMIYADWAAGGRLYKPIEKKISHSIGKYVANPHTSSSASGAMMTYAYKRAREIVKRHVNAQQNDILLFCGTGATGAIWKMIRILDLHTLNAKEVKQSIPEEKRPVVFITHMEHHSNQISWLETLADVVIIGIDKSGKPDLEDFTNLLKKYKSRNLKITSINATSNVTGVKNNHHKIAEIAHAHGSFCFVDFACCAPYHHIDMHPKKPEQKLDAIFFSPHKFLGGPGSSGVLVFDKKLYSRPIPDSPGGGCVSWTTPWNTKKYFENIELREDSGTPGFLQSIKTALAIQLKEKMKLKKVVQREREITKYVFKKLSDIPNLDILAGNQQDRLPIFSFNIKGVHFNLVARLLNDRFGIQARGGCSCAGTYAHYLLNINEEKSKYIFDKVDKKELNYRPGWVRISFHPTMSNKEIKGICLAIEKITQNYQRWSKDYKYNKQRNQYYYEKNFDKELEPIHLLYKN